MTPNDFHVFSRFFTELNTALLGYVNLVAERIITGIEPGVKTLLAIYVSLWGWSMMRGLVNEPIGDGVGRMVRLSIITAVALKIGIYNSYLSNFLFESPDALASLISSNTYSTAGSGNYLDSLLTQMVNFGQKFIDQGYKNDSFIPDYGMIMVGYAVQGAGLIASGYAAFLLALSKISLAVILGIGPIFVLLLIFEGTKKFFDAWIGQAIHAIFVVALTAATLTLIMNILKTYLSNAASTTMPTLPHAISAIVLAVIGILVLLQLPSMAAALSGGVAISSLGAVAWAAKKTPAGAMLLKGVALKAGGAAAKGLNALRPSNVKASASAAMATVKSGAGKVAAGAKADYQATAGAARAVGSVSMSAIRKISDSGGNSISKP